MREMKANRPFESAYPEPNTTDRQRDDTAFVAVSRPAAGRQLDRGGCATTTGTGRMAAENLGKRQGSASAADQLLALQRQFGNRFVQRLLAMATRHPEAAAVNPDVEAAIENARGGGQALDSGARASLEPFFHADFSGVRIHADTPADTLSRALSARAFTVGRDIFFQDGEYTPGSSAGRELLAHELTHVVQQDGGIHGKFAVSSPSDACEAEAEQLARYYRELSEDPKTADGDHRSETMADVKGRHAAEVLKRQTAPFAEGVEETEESPGAGTMERPAPVEEKVEQEESEESLTSEQTLRSQEFKNDHVEHSIGKETGATLNGHLDEWMTEKHTVKKSGSDFIVTIDKLDIHTQVFIWPENSPGKWDKIADFGAYYNEPYDPAFNIHEGTLRHEKQHAVEALNAFKAHEAWFRGEVAKIKKPTRAAAEAEYVTLFAGFRAKQQTTYWANGEVDGQRVEWEYYHSEFEKFIADPLSYGLFDWAVTDEDALKVLKILDSLEKRSVPAFEKMVKFLKDQGLLNRLLDNIGDSDKKTHKLLISKIYLLL